MQYNSTPVTGYQDGIIVSDTAPRKIATSLPDGARNINLWFTIETTHYNVHPYREDLRGYPVRWFQSYAPDGEE